jgi:sialic acid synthase SpsE
MKNKTINVNGFEVGGDKSYIIADIGSNHKQDLGLAKESIDAAAESGADAIKFQSINLNKMYFNPDKNTSDFVKKLEFPEDWHQILNEYCKKRGVVFFSSPTYMSSVDLLEEIDVPLYKLASAQIGTFPQIVERVAKLNKPTIFSTGIANYNQVIKAVNIFEKAGNKKYMILHCNSLYPAPAEIVNLPLMDTYNSMFDCPVGFSDHTDGIHISTAAVAKGAKIIEKHFTLDRNFETPDSTSFAADPKEFSRLVNNIREVEKSLIKQKPRLEIQKDEEKFKNSILYRAITNKNITKGAVIKIQDIKFLRDTYGLEANDLYGKNIIGIAEKSLSENSLLTLDDIRSLK